MFLHWGARLKTEHNEDGKSTTDYPAGVAVVLQETEDSTNAQNGLNIDTVEIRGTRRSHNLSSVQGMCPSCLPFPQDSSTNASTNLLITQAGPGW
jgi:hypothetical protein